MPALWAIVIAIATTRPPTTGAGMLRRARTGIGAPQPVAGEENDSRDGDGIDEIEGKHRDRSGRADGGTPTPKGGRLSHPLGRPRGAVTPGRALQEERAGGELPRIQPGSARQRPLGRREVGRKPPFVGAAAGALDRGLPVSPPGQRPARAMGSTTRTRAPCACASSSERQQPRAAVGRELVGGVRGEDGGAAPAADWRLRLLLSHVEAPRCSRASRGPAAETDDRSSSPRRSPTGDDRTREWTGAPAASAQAAPAAPVPQPRSTTSSTRSAPAGAPSGSPASRAGAADRRKARTPRACRPTTARRPSASLARRST